MHSSAIAAARRWFRATVRSTGCACPIFFSSPSIFARLLDPARGGSFCIQPCDPFTAKRRYAGDTALLETTFQTRRGAVRILDLFPILDGMWPMQPMREVLRIVEGIAGEVEICARLDPRPDYARRKVMPRRQGSLGWRYAWGNEIVMVASDLDLQRQGALLGTVAAVRAGERHYFCLSYTKGDPAVVPLLGAGADDRAARTAAWWRSWSARCAYDGPYRAQVVRSAITLKLLSYALTGAIVAAPTTSLPESPGRDRNWDYRYCWLRDAGLTNRALIGLGYLDEARVFLSWLLRTTRLTRPELQTVYDIFGRTQLMERELTHLDGYRGARPVRIGNGAYAQFQLDVYGEVLVAASAAVAGGERLDAAEARMLTGFGEVICARWREPDSSIWEIRGPPRQYTFSKAACWTALNRLLQPDERGALHLGPAAGRFREVRALIADAIEKRGFNPALGSYASELDGSQVDASLLLMVSIGYKDARDPRMISTYELLQRRLGRNGLLRRYEPGYDGQNSREGAFGICSAWAIDNLAQRGDIAAAERNLDQLLSFANDVGLYAEEIDPETGAALGNFPQAFTHVGVINAALAIERVRKGKNRAC